jgi:DNA-binding protein HU-beta
MNKREMVENIAEATGLTKKDTERAVTQAFQEIAGALAKGEPVQILGFGSFTVRERSARTGRNPKTGEPIAIKSARIPSFRPGMTLKNSVMDSGQ